MNNICNSIKFVGDICFKPDRHVIFYTPFSCVINVLTQTPVSYRNPILKHFFQILHYVGKPLERSSQALLMPLFLFYSTYKTLKHVHQNSSLESGIKLAALSPILLLASTIHSLFFLTMGCIQLVMPFQTIYAVVKGDEACEEFFNFRNYLQKYLKDYYESSPDPSFKDDFKKGFDPLMIITQNGYPSLHFKDLNLAQKIFRVLMLA
jgi:hypothetical protein